MWVRNGMTLGKKWYDLGTKWYGNLWPWVRNGMGRERMGTKWPDTVYLYVYDARVCHKSSTCAISY